MKAVYVIGIMLFMMVTVSSASAATFYLTEIGDDYVYGVPIKVQVDYTDKTMSVKVIEPQNKAYDGYTISNVDLKKVWVKTTSDRVDSVSSPWSYSAKSSSVGNFGVFETEFRKLNDQKSMGPMTVTLKDDIATIIQTKGSYIVAAQVSFDKAGSTETIDCSGKVTGSAQVPEFPTMALPIAAILGILFISQRRKKED